MTVSRRPSAVWDIFEEMLDEATFYSEQWESALASPCYTPEEVIAGPEERLLAQLDGLVLGGRPVAERFLVPALMDDDPGKIFSATWALAQSEDGDHLPALVDAFRDIDPEKKVPIGRALGLSRHPGREAALLTLWEIEDPTIVSTILEIVGLNNPAWANAHLHEFVANVNPVVLPSVLKVFRTLRHGFLTPHVVSAMGSDVPSVQVEAITAGFDLGVPETLHACREAVARGSSVRFPLGVMAALGAPEDRSLIMSMLGDPERRMDGVWAAGFLGDVDAMDAAMAHIEDKNLAPLVADAMAWMTGVSIDGPLAGTEETEDLAEDAPIPEPVPEDLLPTPNPEAVAQWWKKARRNYRPGVRFAMGVPLLPMVSWRPAMRSATTWRRSVINAAWVASAPGAPAFDLRGWCRDGLTRL